MLSIIIESFNFLFFAPTVNLLVAILEALRFLHIPGALGFAIILLTICIRLLMWPLMAKQLNSAKKMSDLKPHLDTLKKKHAANKQALSQAQMALYKEHGINPAAGCLPALLQFPVLIALYQTILAFFGGKAGLDRVNDLIYLPSWHLHVTPSLDFFGVNLATKPSDFSHVGLWLLLIPVITGLFQFIQSKMMMPVAVKEYATDSIKEKKEKEGAEDAMVAVQSQMIYMMPVMIGFFAFQFPVGLALYWNTLTIFGIIQQYKIQGVGGLAPWIEKLRKNK